MDIEKVIQQWNYVLASAKKARMEFDEHAMLGQATDGVSGFLNTVKAEILAKAAEKDEEPEE